LWLITIWGLLVSGVLAGPFSRVIVFGESTSDAGNQFELSGHLFPPSPPYFDGRWSNGPAWIDLVSERLGLGYTAPSARGGTNYAVGGTRSGMGETTTNCSNLGLTMCFDFSGPNYGTQIEMFLAEHPVIQSDDLFAIWGAHNDMFTGVDAQLVADNLAGHVMMLLDHGATDIVFLNLFSGIGQSDRVNRLLRPKMQTLKEQYPAATVVEVDIPAMTNESFAHAAEWGITVLNGQALNTRTLEAVENPDAYLLWDSVHPTAAFNRFVADYVLRAMDPALIRLSDLAQLQPGDADQDLDFDQLDVVRVQIAGR
jgi:phospholipase/lecithinase/hemolysin